MSGVRILDVAKDYVEIPLIKGATARAIVHPGMGAQYASLNYVVMKPGQENVPHCHPQSEDVIVVFQGEGVIEDIDAGVEHPIKKGDVVFVPAGAWHAVKARGVEDFVAFGGPQPPDLAMFNPEWKGK